MTDTQTSNASRRTADFDHHSPDLPEQVGELGVGPVLGKDRGSCPIGWTEAHGGYWFAIAYKELKRIAIDDRTFSSARRVAADNSDSHGVGIPTLPAQFGFLEMDGQDHQAVRRALMPWLASDAVTQWSPVIKDLTNAFLDEVIEKGECDFLEEVASPIPAVLTMMLMGAPLRKWKPWAEAQHQQMATAPDTPERTRAEQLVAEHVQDLVEMIAERRATPPEDGPRDILDVLCHQEIGDRLLSDNEILIHCILVIGGGVDTTTSLMGSAVNWLAQHPEKRDELRNNPHLMRTAIEEFLRVFTPVTGLARTAECPVQVGDQQIDEGERIYLAYAAANFDPDAFDEPDTVKLDRWPNKHTTFGLGRHRCIGLHVAREVINTVLTEVLTRMPDFTIDNDAIEMYPDLAVNQGWASLPMKFTPGSRVGSEFTPAEAAPTSMSETAAAETTQVVAESSNEEEL